MQSITILNPPSSGTLQYYGFPIHSGQWLSAWDIAGGYLTYRANPYHGSAYQDAFTFTANDGNRESASATIHFSVTAGGNTAPTNTNPQISLDPSGVTTLSVDNFPYFDADGDTLTAITILSLPTNGALKLWGQAVTIGQEISAYELEWGALELWLSPSSGGNAATTFSFSISDGIDSSAAATMSATYTGQANSRPLTWTASITTIANEIAILSLQTFPFEDPDDGPSSTFCTITPIGRPVRSTTVSFISNGINRFLRPAKQATSPAPCRFLCWESHRLY